jgi:hypothetical protein
MTPASRAGISSLRSFMEVSYDSRKKSISSIKKDIKSIHSRSMDDEDFYKSLQADFVVYSSIAISKDEKKTSVPDLAVDIFKKSAYAMRSDPNSMERELRTLANLIRKQIPDVPMLARLPMETTDVAPC